VGKGEEKERRKTMSNRVEVEIQRRTTTEEPRWSALHVVNSGTMQTNVQQRKQTTKMKITYTPM
jgi:hypothetical protein